jgi:hypothetical protein
MFDQRCRTTLQIVFLQCLIGSLAACTAPSVGADDETSTLASLATGCGSLPGSIAPTSPATTLFYPHQEIQFSSSASPNNESVAIGDVTGDGLNDVVVAVTISSSPQDQEYIAVLAGDSCHGLAPAVLYLVGPASGASTGLAVGDVTGDGRADVVVTTGQGFAVLVHKSDGTLASPVSYPVTLDGSLWEKVAVGDFNGDERKDVALLGWGGQSVHVLYQDQTGTLGAPSAFTVPHGGYDDIATGHLDHLHSSRLDLVVMSGQTYAVSNVSVLLQGTGGAFQPAVGYDVPPTVFSDGTSTKSLTHGVAVGDVTGDKKDDVVTTYGGNSPTSFVAVFPGLQTTLAAPVTYPCLDIPTGVAVRDVNADGLRDVLIQHDGWGNIGVLLGKAGGTLEPEQLFPAVTDNFDPKGFAVGDINGDGAPDALVANNGQLSVLFNAKLRTPAVTTVAR